MKFVNEHKQREFELAHPRLIEFVCAADYALSKLSLELVVTHVFRTEREQREFYPLDPNRHSPHQDWRAVDAVPEIRKGEVRPEQVMSNEIVELVARVGSVVVPEQVGVMPWVVHEGPKEGRKEHLHFQVARSLDWNYGGVL